MKKSFLIITTLLLLFQFTYSQETRVYSDSEWETDLDSLVQILEKKHPNPYYRISKHEFLNKVNTVRALIPQLTDRQIVLEFMKIVALLKDGHTGIIVEPKGIDGFDDFFPVRFFHFSDGWYITMIDSTYSSLIGARVLQIGNLSIGEAVSKVSPIINADNSFGVTDIMPFYLVNGGVLESAGITSSTKLLPIKVEKNGIVHKINLVSSKHEFDSEWIKSPLNIPVGNVDTSIAKKYTNNLHLKHLNSRNYWFEYLKSDSTLYMQFNAVFNENSNSFSEFYDSLFLFLDSHQKQIKKFIIDMRYNAGGNGGILLPFIHEIIKHEDLFDHIDFYTIIGKRTFSAAIIASAYLNIHTNCTFVGEPAAAPLNFFSDANTYKLPNSKLSLYVSTLYFQLSIPANQDTAFYPDFPVEMSSHDYFNFHDPVLNIIVEDKAKPLIRVCLQSGVEKAMQHYKEISEMYKPYKWWKPVSENELNSYGYQLLNNKQYDEALKILTLNTKIFPNSWNTWDSLGELYLLLRNIDKTEECYKKSYILNPNNKKAKYIVDKIKETKNKM